MSSYLANISVKLKVFDKMLLRWGASFAAASRDNIRRHDQLHLAPSEEERQLFRDIANNDQEAFRAFYELTSSRVYGYCMKMGKSVPVATELLQETYLTLWKERKYLAEVIYPRAYVVRIASRAVYKYFSKRNNSRQVIELYEADQLLQPLDMAAHASLETKEILQVIENAVRKLPPQQEKVFRMNKLEGFSYKEISEQLGLSISTVGNYLEIAMKKVRASVLGEE
jgi:RNA polymerase sigma-70 factor (ECF subfamily)